MSGFFTSTKIQSKAKVYLVPHCEKCGLYKTCQSPKMPLWGEGKQEILIIGEVPGFNEDQQNRPFIGKSGQYLRKALKKHKIDLDRDCWVTNSLICHKQNNENPTPKELDYCSPNLMRVIEERKPRLILTFGKFAIQSLLQLFFSDSKHFGTIGKWLNWRIPFQEWNCQIHPNWHPSYVVRQQEERDGPVVELLFDQYLSGALEKIGERPWKEIPDYDSQIELIFEPRQAAMRIRQFIADGGTCSWDVETNRIKPDSPDAVIVCCSICWKGKETICYPWVGEAIQATKEFIIGTNKKIGFNMKFEDRWSRAILGVPVNNWIWDGMLASHHLDNRRGICSLEFQALTRLGVTPYDHHIKPYLKSADASGVNRVRQLDLRALLKYYAYDSLFEYLVAVDQRREMKYG